MAKLPRTPFAPEHLHANTGGRSDVVVWCVAGMWLALSVTGLWRYQAQVEPNMPATIFEVQDPRLVERWFEREMASADSRGGKVQATVVSITNPGCTCDAAQVAQLNAISATYRRRGVRFLTVGQTLDGKQLLPSLKAIPAALVFDRGGRLSYYGPYAQSASCGGGDGPLIPVLDRILAGRPTRAVPVVGRACSCS